MRLRLKLNTIQKTEFKLSAEAVDTIAVEVEQFLRALSFERANILRIRLSVEEALLCWLDHFGEGKPVFFSLGTRWRVPVIVLDLAGEAYDPTAAAGTI